MEGAGILRCVVTAGEERKISKTDDQKRGKEFNIPGFVFKRLR